MLATFLTASERAHAPALTRTEVLLLAELSPLLPEFLYPLCEMQLQEEACPVKPLHCYHQRLISKM